MTSPLAPPFSLHAPLQHPEAYVSLVTNDNYALGALALGRSLRDTLTTRKLSLLATNEVSDTMRYLIQPIPGHNGQTGDKHFVHCSEAVPSSEVEMI